MRILPGKNVPIDTGPWHCNKYIVLDITFSFCQYFRWHSSQIFTLHFGCISFWSKHFCCHLSIASRLQPLQDCYFCINSSGVTFLLFHWAVPIPCDSMDKSYPVSCHIIQFLHHGCISLASNTLSSQLIHSWILLFPFTLPSISSFSIAVLTCMTPLLPHNNNYSISTKMSFPWCHVIVAKSWWRLYVEEAGESCTHLH